MPITLPDFKNSHCTWITACAELPTVSKELSKWMRNEKPMIAPYKIGGGKGYCRVTFGGGTGKHLHIDLARASAFPNEMKKKAKNTIGQIQKRVERFMGKEAEVGLTAGFEVSLDELPEGGMIRSLSFETKMGNVSVKMSGAKFIIQGAPIQEILWHARPDKTIVIKLDAESVKVRVSENYLPEFLSILETSFNVFILGKGPNEAK
jgi:hypothetical protein